MFSKQDIKRKGQLLIIKIRNILQTSISREFLIFLFFVFIASTFWILQTLNENYETEFEVPLRLKNVPENVIITSDFPKELKFRVKDKGTVLANYILGQDFLPVTIDFEDFRQKGNYVRISSKALEKKLLSQLAVSTSLEAIKPDTLEMIYAEGRAKMIPVKIGRMPFAGKQYYIADQRIQPDSVKVYAPQEVLDTLEYVYTQTIKLDEIEDTAHVRVPLRPLRGVKLIPEVVDAYFYADMLTEKTVEVPIVGEGFPSNRQLKTFPSRVSVTFQVGMNCFKSVGGDDFKIIVYYDELKNKQDEQCQLHLVEMPTGVSHVRISPEHVDYLIENLWTDEE